MTHGRFTAGVREERGAVMVMVAILLPVLILFSSFVIDVGNWFEHRRHLQMQADAAVLAAAGEFGSPCSEAPIEDMARTYGGLKPPTPNTYNQQVGGTPLENVLFEGLNRKTWPNQPGKVDPDPPGGPPCETGVIDVKLAEADLPWFFRVAQVPFINAHARVAIQKVDRMKGVLPIGVPDINPKKAKALFVDESKLPTDSGYVIKETMLCRTGAQNGLAQWSSAGGCSPGIGPVPVRIDTQDIGVRIVLSGSDSTTCGEALVVCYDTGTKDGLVHIRGWSAAEQAFSQAPKARDVWLRSGTCPDGYFVASTTACAAEVVAAVDFGSSDPVALGAKIDATVGNKSYALSYDATEKLWKSASSTLVPVPADGSRVTVGLKWTITKKADGTNCSGKDTCSGSLGAVQRAFSASDLRSGPIQQLRVAEHEPDGTLKALGANSFQRCASAEDTSCERNLSVSVAIKGSLLDTPNGPDDPPVEMRVVGSGSQNQSLNCDPDVPKLQDQLAQGCGPEYTVNDGAGCPATKNDLWATAQPWSCSALFTGEKTQAISRGMNARINGDPTTNVCKNPSRWDDYWDDGTLDPVEYADDPRVVQVFLTPFGSFDGSGQAVVPVLQFAAFYVTGWTGQGGDSNPCPVPPDDEPTEDKGGYLVGYFITYINRVNNGEGSGEACDFDAVQICVPVLTK
jgi:hypothetical protein